MTQKTCINRLINEAVAYVTDDGVEQKTRRYLSLFFPMARQPLGGLGRLIFRGFTITLRHTTLGRAPLDE